VFIHIEWVKQEAEKLWLQRT